MNLTRLIVITLVILGLLVSLVSAGGYADPKSYEEWRPATIAEADAGNVVGHLNRAIVHLTGLYVSTTHYAPVTNIASTIYNGLFAATNGVYSPMTNRASPVYVESEWTYGGYPYYTNEELGPISNRCG